MRTFKYTCHGLAVPFNVWMDPRPDEPPDRLSLRYRPGAFAGAIQRTDVPPSRLSLDHITTEQGLDMLGGPVRYWEEADGLHFESPVHGRLHGLIRKGWITGVCFSARMLPDEEPVRGIFGLSLHVHHVPQLLDLALCLVRLPHFRESWVRCGPHPNPQPLNLPVASDWSATEAIYRVVPRARDPERMPATCYPYAGGAADASDRRVLETEG